MSKSIDLVVFGPHPDDSEIGMGATIAKHVADGKSVGLCDLSAGELGTNGTPAERRSEADDAAKVLGVCWRENLGWPDGGLSPNPELIRSAAAFLRRHRPRAIAVPYWQDRHPDHGAASETLTDRGVSQRPATVRYRRTRRSLAARVDLPLLHQ